MASEDDDQNSLFGSPSPSRSPSPVLALPTARVGASEALSVAQDTQNVGTIALPGSLHCSELPKDPLALSLSYPSAPRPRTRCHPTTMGTPPSPTLPSGASTPSSGSRASSVVSIATRKKKKKARKEAEPSRAPSITLPDPSVPPPPNFLRNQMALLGTAGLVARIKPAKMQLGVSRGSTPTNPIVLDEDHDAKKPTEGASRISGVLYDENDAPRLGKRSGSLTPSLDIDTGLLPAPTNKEIVATLIGQKDIFPVLQEILRLIAGQKAAEQVSAAAMASRMQQKRTLDAHPPSARTATGPRAPPLKRRRLSRVPAGAADWDVPYPFQEGEGPEEYHKTWERERGRQLISQLVNLIRTAARKAATKKYFLQQEACRQAQRAQSAPVSVKDMGSPKIPEEPGRLPDEAGAPQRQPSLHETAPIVGVPQPFDGISSPFIPLAHETTLDDLISSLLAASSTTEVTPVQDGSVSAPGTDLLSAPSAAFVSAASGEDVNDGLINSWMNIFQTFPIPSDGFSSAWDLPKIPEQQPSSASTPSSPETYFNFFDTSLFNLNMHLPLSLPNPTESINFFASPELSSALFPPRHEEEQPICNDPILEMDNVTRDPMLSAISHPQPRPLANLNQISNLTQNDPILALAISEAEESRGSSESAESPMRSTSSAGCPSADPSTPASATWESTMPDVVFSPPGNQLQDPLSSQGVGEDGENDDNGDAQGEMEPKRFTAQEKGKWKGHVDMNVDDGDDRAEQGDSPISTTPPLDPLMGRSPSQPPTEALGQQPGQKRPSKQEIIRLAKERRQQLVEELEQVKLRLWEATIEQSVLMELQKQLLP